MSGLPCVMSYRLVHNIILAYIVVCILSYNVGAWCFLLPGSSDEHMLHCFLHASRRLPTHHHHSKLEILSCQTTLREN